MSQTGPPPGHRVAALAFLTAFAAAALDLTLGGRLSLFFDLCFIVTCVGLGLLARATDLLTIGVLPPLIMCVTFLPLAVLDPGALAHPRDGVVQAVVTGFASHATALVVGFGLCLGVLVARQRSARRGSGRQGSGRQGSGRQGSGRQGSGRQGSGRQGSGR